MLKIKGTIDRYEGERAVVRAGGEDIIMPKKYLEGFAEGEVIAVVIAGEKEDTENSSEVAKSLVADLFKEE